MYVWLRWVDWGVEVVLLLEVCVLYVGCCVVVRCVLVVGWMLCGC